MLQPTLTSSNQSKYTNDRHCGSTHVHTHVHTYAYVLITGKTRLPCMSVSRANRHGNSHVVLTVIMALAWFFFDLVVKVTELSLGLAWSWTSR